MAQNALSEVLTALGRVDPIQADLHWRAIAQHRDGVAVGHTDNGSGKAIDGDGRRGQRHYRQQTTA